MGIWNIGTLNEQIYEILKKWSIECESFILIVNAKGKVEPIVMTDSIPLMGEVSGVERLLV